MVLFHNTIINKCKLCFHLADDDSNLTSSEIQFRRKAVNVIEDSDSDAGGPNKNTAPSNYKEKVVDRSWLELLKYSQNDVD